MISEPTSATAARCDSLRLLTGFYKKKQRTLLSEAVAEKDVLSWQMSCQREVEKAIGFQELPVEIINEKKVEEVDRKDHIRKKIWLELSFGVKLPVYILIPANTSGPLPVVLAFHGHGYGARDIVGVREDGSERDTPEGYHKDFAIELCRKGFLVAAPEIMGFGENIPDFSYLQETINKYVPKPCNILAGFAQLLGGSVLGLRVWQGRCLIAYLDSLAEADTSRLGAMGISGGGMHTFFSTAIDERIKACVISGYFCSWFESILKFEHCRCNFAPGLLNIGDLPYLAGLLAPRPVLIEAGTLDSIFPIDPVRTATSQLRNIYKMFNAESKVELDEFEGDHQISGKRAYDFLFEKLVNI